MMFFIRMSNTFQFIQRQARGSGHFAKYEQWERVIGGVERQDAENEKPKSSKG